MKEVEVYTLSHTSYNHVHATYTLYRVRYNKAWTINGSGGGPDEKKKLQPLQVGQEKADHECSARGPPDH